MLLSSRRLTLANGFEALGHSSSTLLLLQEPNTLTSSFRVRRLFALLILNACWPVLSASHRTAFTGVAPTSSGLLRLLPHSQQLEPSSGFADQPSENICALTALRLWSDDRRSLQTRPLVSGRWVQVLSLWALLTAFIWPQAFLPASCALSVSFFLQAVDFA